MSETDLHGTIEQLSQPEVAEALKNVRIVLQHRRGNPIGEDEVRQELAAADTPGDAGALRDTIISGAQTQPEEIERWGKSLLHCLAADPDLVPEVQEAIGDAQLSNSKDFGLSALIVVGAIIVLLKYRPTSLKTGKSGTEIKWRENDVSIVKDLIKGVSGGPGGE